MLKLTTLENISDEKLLTRYQKGDVRAFGVLLQRHHKGVLNFVYRFLGRPEAAEDIVQEAFLRLVANPDRFERRSKFTTWLYTIVRNLCIDYLRKQKHRNHLSLDQPLNPGSEREVAWMENLESNQAWPDKQTEDRRTGEILQAAIGRLNQEQREVFLMREEAAMTFEEIARVVEAPVNTVKSRMRYALQGLRSYLEDQGIEL